MDREFPVRCISGAVSLSCVLSLSIFSSVSSADGRGRAPASAGSRKGTTPALALAYFPVRVWRLHALSACAWGRTAPPIDATR
ncbi:hypothetical protein B0H16DRAFT_967790 [Mycena metata]|uniref:Secreted protein n=1 Tax=Mycena metata TaxID=1033252 RepID=A0AAD7ILR0_9AGAR|nr:hypothetical protein B0H16DRAFT_967790 [Mycena metata]